MIINTDSAKHFLKPYPHILINNALYDYDSFSQDYPDIDSFSTKIRMDGDLSWPEKNYFNLINSSDNFLKLHSYIYSKNFVNDFLDLFKNDILSEYEQNKLIFNPFEIPIREEPFEVNKIFRKNEDAKDLFLYPRIDIGYGKIGYGKNNGGGGIHVDNFGRLISCLIYFDDSINMVGGEHRMYKYTNGSAILAKQIKPKNNLLLASLQSNFALHDVNPITQISGTRRAIYFAISCSKKIWAESDKRLMRLTKSRYKENIWEKLARIF